MSYREVADHRAAGAADAFFGFYPAPVLDVTAVSVKKLVSGYEASVQPGAGSGEAVRGRSAPTPAHELEEPRPHAGVDHPTRRRCPRSLSRSARWLLLMLGVFRTPRRARDGASSAGSRSSSCSSPPGSSLVWRRDRAAAVRRRLHRRRLRPLHEAARCSAGSGLAADHVVRLLARAKLLTSSSTRCCPAGRPLGMMMMVSASDLIALYLGPRAAEPGALRASPPSDRDDARSSEAGLKYFVLGALSSGMLLYGASLIYGFTGSTELHRHRRGRARRPRAAQHRPDLRPRVPARRPRLQGLGRAVPHVDARRLRGRADAGHRLLRRRAQAGRHGAAHARHARRPSPASRRSGSRSSSSSRIASMLLGAFAAIGQTNIKRLLAYSSIGNIGYALIGLAAGQRGGHAGGAHLSGDLPGHDARRLRLHPVHAPQATGTVEDIDELAGLAEDQPAAWRSCWRCCCSRWPAFRRSPASSPSSTCSPPPSRRASIRSPSSACWRAWSAPTTTCASSRSCSSTSAQQEFLPVRAGHALRHGARRAVRAALRVWPGAARRRGARGSADRCKSEQ